MNCEVLLKTLQHAPQEPNQRSLAQQLGFSLGKTNYILNALIDTGFIKAERFANSDNKLAYRYVLTAAGIQERIRLTEKFILRKKQEYERLSQDLIELKQASALAANSQHPDNEHC